MMITFGGWFCVFYNRVHHLNPSGPQRFETEIIFLFTPFQRKSRHFTKRLDVHWQSGIDGSARWKAALRQRVSIGTCQWRCWFCYDDLHLLVIASGFKSDFLDSTAIKLIIVCAVGRERSLLLDTYIWLFVYAECHFVLIAHLTPPDKLFVPLCPSSITLFSCLLVSVELGAVWWCCLRLAVRPLPSGLWIWHEILV